MKIKSREKIDKIYDNNIIGDQSVHCKKIDSLFVLPEQ